MNKKYIMITGSSHSGSTIIGAILGNFKEKNGLDVGEIYVLFNQNIQYSMQIDPFWHLLEEKCSEDNILEYLFKEFDYIIDSSKLLSWYKIQRKIASNLNIDIKHVHVFRHPISWYNSRRQRNQEGDYTYYIRHNTNPLIWSTPDAIVYLPDLRENPETFTKKLCEVLEIPYWSGKHEYWKSHMKGLFGSPKARDSKKITKPISIDETIYVPEQVMSVYNELMDSRLK